MLEIFQYSVPCDWDDFPCPLDAQLVCETNYQFFDSFVGVKLILGGEEPVVTVTGPTEGAV